MNGEITSCLELCVREKAHLQHGMNWRIQSTHSVFLMSTRKGSPYDDRIEDEGRTLIYEGHDAPKKNSKPGVFAKGSRMKDVNWVANTTRGTNDYMHCSHLIYLYDQNINFIVARWLGDSSQAFKDAYALTELIQWVLRSRVRRGEPVTLYLPSPRMRRLFEEWLND